MGGGGLLLTINRRLSSRLINFSCSSPDIEVLGVEVFVNDSYSFQVINIFSPPGKINRDWLNQILSNCKAPFVLVGDLPYILGGGGGTVTLLRVL